MRAIQIIQILSLRARHRKYLAEINNLGYEIQLN